MKKAYSLAITASIHVIDPELYGDAATIVRSVILGILSSVMLMEDKPEARHGMVSVRHPNDTYVRVNPVENGRVEVLVSVR